VQTLYKDYLLDHYRYPRNAGVLVDANCSATQENPACGDAVSMTGLIQQGIMRDVRFAARGCVICVAGASLMSDQIIGLTVQEIDALDATTMITLLGIPLGPTRLKCALLPLYALHDALKNYSQKAVAQ
jgi:nitrogen fixation protein NifU and related proteins